MGFKVGGREKKDDKLQTCEVSGSMKTELFVFPDKFEAE